MNPVLDIVLTVIGSFLILIGGGLFSLAISNYVDLSRQDREWKEALRSWVIRSAPSSVIKEFERTPVHAPDPFNLRVRAHFSTLVGLILIGGGIFLIVL